MNQKRVSFEVAKAIKEAGYPQTINSISSEWYLPNGQLYTSYIDATIPLREFHTMLAECIAPTYFEVWLWLWREKRKSIDIVFNGYSWESSENCEDCNDPEEAIIAAIEYLADNDLIK